RHGERNDQHRERNQDDGEDDLADHGRRLGVRVGARPSVRATPGYVPQAPGSSSRLSRSRISLPVLKNGTYFWSTDTCAPVRGLRPVRAGRFVTEKAPKPRSSTRSPRAMAAMTSPRIALTMFSTSRW